MRKRYLFLVAILSLGMLVYSNRYKCRTPKLDHNEIYVYKNKKNAKPICIKTNRITGVKHKNSLELVQSLLKKNALVFDIGANIGEKTDLYLECKARVVCFEPQPKCLQVLRNKFQNYSQVSIESIGLGSKNEELELHICSASDALSTFSINQMNNSRFSNHGFEWNEKICVPIRTLDSMIEKYGKPFYCKIDVENYEYEVIKGLSHSIPLLSFECNTEHWELGKKSILRLVTLGFNQFNYAVGGTDLFLFSNWLDPDAFIQKIEEVLKEKDFSEVWGLWGDVYAKTAD